MPLKRFFIIMCNLSFKDMKFLGIIPARYASTRFPAKPLALLGERPLFNGYMNKWPVFWMMLM